MARPAIPLPRRRRHQHAAAAWLAAAAASLLGAPAATACDLKAEFTAPVASSLNAAQPITWMLRFSNAAPKGDCAANQVSLLRQPSGGGGLSTGGTGAMLPAVGGVGPAQKLPALPPGRSVDLTFVEQRPPTTGSYVYRPQYLAAVVDANASNHHPEKTVTFSVTLTLGN